MCVCVRERERERERERVNKERKNEIKNGDATNTNHRVTLQQYTTSLPNSWDVGCGRMTSCVAVSTIKRKRTTKKESKCERYIGRYKEKYIFVC